MAYIEESLSTGERIEAIFRLHWFSWVSVFVWVALGLAAVVVTGWFGFQWVLGLAAAALLWLFAVYAWLSLRFTEQGVTNKRVIHKVGIISRKTDEMKLSSIETVEIDQGVFGRIFGFGDVRVTGRGLSDLVFKSIDDPMTVKRAIEGISHPAA